MTWICATCAVETAADAEPPPRCEICEDERQWVPADGQRWTTLDALWDAGQGMTIEEVEPGLLGLRIEPRLGIGQQAMVARVAEGTVLFDPPGFLDDESIAAVRGFGTPLAIAVSHPHMYGVMSSWSEVLDVPVLVPRADRAWPRRTDRIEWYDDRYRIADGLVLHRVGGHFAGSAVLEWADGAEDQGVLLAGDAIFPNPDRRTVSFLRSYPNRLPLSGAVVLRIADTVEALRFDRLYNNFGSVVPSNAKQVVRESAERHAAWCRGEHDDLTW
ncbi:MBL fold metallo-hydrolase [Cumulibacter manganitolerans]|uniref:hydrolase n=1 Tax=Cumulibacter manganitolerans TaxID=1884992 RepID=UPI001297E366|nr:hydrolase [Cumulibacter manganitolerans]